jgi:RHS repeat-associated protein
MKYTGHERDLLASNPNTLDYMHARYYSPTAGRFLSVDPVLGNPSAPQSWNRYAYVANNPLNRIDPDGRADTGINLIWNRLKHIIDNHINKEDNLNKSKFVANNPKDVQKLVQKTVKPQNLVKTQTDGRNVYEKTFNKTVGTEGESTVRTVTEPVSATSEKVITTFPTMNTLASIVNVAGLVDTAAKLYGYGESFQNQYGREPTFNESLRFMATGDARSDHAVMLDAIKQVY